MNIVNESSSQPKSDFIDPIKNFFVGVFWVFIFFGLVGFLIGYPLQAIALLLLWGFTKD